MMFGFNDLFNSAEYIIEIYEGTALVQQQKVTLPEQMAQGQFMQLCQQIKSTGHPMKVKMIRYDWVEGRDTPLECSIEYQTWSD